jgi:hypothetical protein
MLTCTAFAADRLSIFTKEYSGIESEEAMMEKLQAKSFEELIDDINATGDSVDVSSLIFHASALAKKASDVPTEQLQSEIMNVNNSDTTRTILIQINKSLANSVDNDVLIPLLEQKDVDFEIKRNILLNIYKANLGNADVLEKIALAEDGRLAFQAIKMLNTVDSNKAIEISDSIIQEYTGVVTDKMRAAIKVKASQLAGNSTIAERIEFVDFCDGVLSKSVNTKGTSDVITDTVIFALSDVMSEETISYIVNSKTIDHIAKVYCVEQNYPVLKSMLEKSTSTEKLDVVIEAMKICPLVDMTGTLQEVLTAQLRQHSAQAEKTTEKLQDVLRLIKNEGITATNKY